MTLPWHFVSLLPDEVQDGILRGIHLFKRGSVHDHELLLFHIISAYLEDHRFGVSCTIVNFVHLSVPLVHFTLASLDLTLKLTLFSLTVLF